MIVITLTRSVSSKEIVDPPSPLEREDRWFSF